MLEKGEGAVSCAHCRSLGADTVCPYCRRAVCTGCLGPVGCAVPHPEELRLGTGRRLRAVDEAGRVGLVEPVLAGAPELRKLRTAEPLHVERPRHAGKRVQAFGLPGFNGGKLGWAGVSFEVVGTGDSAQVQYLDALLLVAELEKERVVNARYLLRPKNELEIERTLLSEDGKLAVIVSASRLDVLDTLDGQTQRRIDLDGEMIQCLAFSNSADLLAVGLFDRLMLYRLSSLLRLATVGNKLVDIAAVGVGKDRAVALSVDGQLLVLDRASKYDWTQREVVALDVRGKLRADEASLSHDGRLLAYRSGRKRVSVRCLETGAVQQIRGHTDRVSFVRFADSGELLVTADDDNRVWLWPRDADRLVVKET